MNLKYTFVLDFRRSLSVLALSTFLSSGCVFADEKLLIDKAFEHEVVPIASNIKGLMSIRHIGHFHAGGAIPSNPEFLLSTLPGKVLDPERLLVANKSNYGMALGHSNMKEGSLLSVDLSRGAFEVPEGFAGQTSSAVDGKVIMYSANSKRHLNKYYNNNSVTRHMPNVSNPKYISINNAFGRPWQANAPFGVEGPGHVSVSDPDGSPLANPPSVDNGGVFFGSISNRIYGDYWLPTYVQKLIPGNLARKTSNQYISGSLTSGSVGTVFMGISPDSSNFAVFGVVNADGSLAQIHVQDGTDGLIAQKVIEPIKDENVSAGMVFQWIPERSIYVSDFYQNRIARVLLDHDDYVFTVDQVSYLTHEAINSPVDIAAAVPEIANPRFSSNTTLAGASDLYIANQDGEILRLSQTGELIARVKLNTDHIEQSDRGRIKAISTSYDGKYIYLGMEGKDDRDFISVMPAFDESGFMNDENLSFEAAANPKPEIENKPLSSSCFDVRSTTEETGECLFTFEFSAETGLGEKFNQASCVACHDNPVVGGFSSDEEDMVRRVGYFDKELGQFQEMPNSLKMAHSFKRIDDVDGKAESLGLVQGASLVSMRMPLSLIPTARIDDIPDSVLLSHARSKGDGVQGRVNYVDTPEGKKIGRYGWKAQEASLPQMVSSAMKNEMSIDLKSKTEDRSKHLNALVSYIRSLNNDG